MPKQNSDLNPSNFISGQFRILRTVFGVFSFSGTSRVFCQKARYGRERERERRVEHCLCLSVCLSVCLSICWSLYLVWVWLWVWVCLHSTLICICSCTNAILRGTAPAERRVLRGTAPAEQRESLHTYSKCHGIPHLFSCRKMQKKRLV